MSDESEPLDWHSLMKALRALRERLVVVGVGGEGAGPEQMTLSAFGRLDVDGDRFVLLGPDRVRVATLELPRERYVVAVRTADGFLSIAMRDLSIVVFENEGQT